MSATAKKPAHKYKVGQIVNAPWRAKILELTEWYSKSLDMYLPQYKIQYFLGTTDKLDSYIGTLHEHEISPIPS